MKGKYHCTDDLLFDSFGSDQTSISKAANSKQNKQEVSLTVILPLQLVFYAFTFVRDGHSLEMKIAFTYLSVGLSLENKVI